MNKNANRGVEWGTNVALALSGGACVVLGALVVLAWHFNLTSLLRLGATLLPGPYVAGWAMLITGSGVLLLLARRPRTALALATVLGLLVLLTGLQYLSPFDTGIDRLRLPLSGIVPGLHPIRLSAVATIEFGLAALGLTLLARSHRNSAWINAFIAFIGIGLIVVALVARVAVEIVTGAGVVRVLSVGATVAFVLLGIAFLAYAWRQEIRRGRDIMRWLPGPITIGLAFGTVVLWQTLLVNERVHAKQFVAAETTYIREKIATELQTQILDVVRLADQWERRGQPDLDKWAMDAALTVDGRAGLYALAWIDPERRIRRTVPSDEARALAAGVRLVHAQAALAAAARGEREPRLSPLIDVAPQRQGFYVYVPLINGRTGDSLFVGMFHPHALLSRILDADVARGFAISVDAGSRVAYAQRRPDTRYVGEWSGSGAFSLYGLDWRVRATPSEQLLSQLRTHVPLLVLIAGLLLSGMTGTSLFLAQTARVRAGELARSNRDLVHEIDERRRVAERFRRLLAAAPDAIVIVDQAGRIVLSNRQAQRLFGYDETELAGRPIEVLIPPRFRSQHSEQMRGYIAQPHIRAMGEGAELHGLRKNGEEFPVEISLGPIETEQGILVSAAIRDVSERRAREEALRQSEERFRLVVEGVQDYAIFMLDPEGRVVSWNSGAERIMGYAASEVLGRHFRCFFMPEDAAGHAPEHELAVAEAEGRMETEGWRVRKDGTRFFSSVVMTPVRDPHGRLVGYAKVTRDISEHRRQELALRRQTELIALLQDVAVAANEADTIEEAIARSLDRIGEVTGWPVGHAYLVSDSDGRALRSTPLWRLADGARYAALVEATRHAELGTGRGLVGEVLERAGPVWSADLEATLLPERWRAAQAAGLRAAFAFPVLVRARVVGLLEFFANEDSGVEPDLIEAMTHIGTQLGRVVERKWSEEAMRASEARFRSVTESASDAIISVDSEGMIVTWNQGAQRLFGYSKSEMLGRDYRSLLPAAQQSRLRALATRERPRMKSGEVAEMTGRRKDGDEFPAEISLAAWDVGDAHYYGAIVRDVSARKQAEARIKDLNETLERRVIERTAQAERARARLAFLAEASAILASSLDYAATLAQVARLAVPYLAEWCVVDMLEEGGALRRVKIAHADPAKEALGLEIDRRYPADLSSKIGPIQVIRSGAAEMVSEITDDMIKGRDAEHDRMLRDLGLRSYMCVPLIARGRTLGAITFITGDVQRRYDETDLELARDLARRCATAVDNARLYQAAQDELRERQRAEQEIRFQANLLSVVGQAVVATDTDGRVVYWNPFAERLFGWTAAQASGTPVTRLVAPESDDTGRAVMSDVLAGGMWSGELNLCRSDGSVFPALATASPIRDERDRVIGIIGVSSDITAQKNAEKLIELRERQQAQVATIGQRALAGAGLDALFDQAVRSVAATLEVEMCKVLECLPGRRALLLRAGIGWQEGLIGHETVSAGIDSQAGYTLASDGPVIVEDLRKETRFSGPQLLIEHGVISGLSVRIPGRDRPYGVLGAHTRIQRDFSEDDIHFMQGIANVLASAIERERTDAERMALLQQEQEARLEAEAARGETERARQRLALVAEVSAGLAAALDYDAALDKLAHIVVPAFADWCAVDIATDDGAYRRLTVAHAQPEKERFGYELQRRLPPDPAMPYGYPKVLRTGKPEFHAQVPEALLSEKSWDPEQLRMLRELGYRSYMCVPLIARGRTFGAISFVIGNDARRYVDADLAFAEDLARRAALALDNAQLYREAQQELAERRRAEELLADEKERLAVTLHSIGDGVITTDAQGCIVLLNKIAEDLTGWSQRDAEGRPLIEVFNIINEKTRKPCENPVEKVLKTGKIIGLANHTALVRKDGSERVIADSGAPIRDRSGRIIGVVLVFRDITDQQKMEEDLQKSHKLESIGILAGGIAHDFNNILTAILGNISLAKMYSQPGDRISAVLNEAENAFWRARDLTQQLLTFSKGGAPIKKSASVAELLRDTCSFVLSGSKVRCRFEIAADLWPAEFDAGQISQVVNNLLINAQQAMPQGGVVTIRAENVTVNKKKALPLSKGRYVKIMIEDQGIGIPEEHIGRVFDPYFTTKQTGSGLGLATSYSIIKRHDGYIDVQSQVGKGTTFTVYLPASRAPAEAAAADADKTAPGHGRILFMDDEETVRRVGGEILTRLGYEVEYATEGAEMLEYYTAALEEGEPFDAVIMDLTIPGGMGGKEAVAKLLEIDPKAVAIVSSGYFNDPVMADHERYGFRGVIAKPYKVKELGDTLRNALGRK